MCMCIHKSYKIFSSSRHWHHWSNVYYSPPLFLFSPLTLCVIAAIPVEPYPLPQHVAPCHPRANPDPLSALSPTVVPHYLCPTTVLSPAIGWPAQPTTGSGRSVASPPIFALSPCCHALPYPMSLISVSLCHPVHPCPTSCRFLSFLSYIRQLQLRNSKCLPSLPKSLSRCQPRWIMVHRT
jgi:hypothetical protein